MQPTLTLPADFSGLPLVLSVSGGKDSTAAILAVREAGLPVHSYVFADTEWEAPQTYAHLDTLRRILDIEIAVVGKPGGMAAAVDERFGFPAGRQRWCTRKLKLEPLREYHDGINEGDTVSVLGIRAEESDERAKLPEVADDDEWGGWIWRPLLGWTIADVIGIHRRHSVPMNPLYHEGFGRVGCFPCIYANKEELRMLASRYPERIDEIAGMESRVSAARATANVEEPGRFKDMPATMFTLRAGKRKLSTGIRTVIEWAKTDRGGRQYPLLEEPPRGGCMRWGLCETAPAATDDAEALAETNTRKAG